VADVFRQAEDLSAALLGSEPSKGSGTNFALAQVRDCATPHGMDAKKIAAAAPAMEEAIPDCMVSSGYEHMIEGWRNAATDIHEVLVLGP
jgi:hypothetical protein